MPTSDSEDFESADEGQSSVEKKQRKKRLSSSNYSDNSLDTDPKTQKNISSNVAKETPKKEADGWDDFEIDETPIEETVQNKNETSKESTKSQDTGWDDFGDWGDESATVKESPKPEPEADIKEVTDRLAAASTTTNSGGWGWGWGVDSLLSTASAGISTITSQVSQGISNVLETGIGIPEPEELAKQSKTSKENQPKPDTQVAPQDSRTAEPSRNEPEVSSSGDAFQFGSLLSGVTKFVESTGTKVIAGGLGTLETIGKKTMEVLQDGDPGLAKKRAMLGLDAGKKLVLSQVLREAKAKAEEEDRIKEEKREAKEVHYENLFDDFEGLVHLEALEMLSRQVTMRIEERTRGATPKKRQDIKETLQQVAELCEMPEEDDDDEETSDDQPRPDALHDRLQTATQDLGLKLQFQPLVKQYTDILASLDSQAELTEKSIYKRAVSGLAQATALCVELYHKTAEMLLVKPRRSTADEADALTQMTVVLTKHISELATLFTEKLNSIPTENKEQVNTYITNIFLEAGNSSTYVQNAFQLALPILQIGAV